MGFIFDIVVGVSNSTKNVFLSKFFSRFSLRFIVICQNFAIFQESSFSRKTCLWLLNVLRFSKYLFPQKLYIQGRTLVSEKRKPKTFSISSELEFSCTKMAKDTCYFKLQYIAKPVRFCFLFFSCFFSGGFHAAELYLESCQTSKAEVFTKNN